MSFLSVLGKIGKGALGLVPGGGTITQALDIASDLGGVLGAGAKSSADARRVDDVTGANMGTLNNRAQLDAGEFNMSAPGMRASQVARGDVLSTMKDAAPTGDARIDKFGGGGLRPSAFGPDSRQAGEALKKQAFMALMTGSDQITPQMSAPSSSGLLEKIGGTAGVIGGITGMADKGIQATPVATMPQTPQVQTPELPPDWLLPTLKKAPFSNVRFG